MVRTAVLWYSQIIYGQIGAGSHVDCRVIIVDELSPDEYTVSVSLITFQPVIFPRFRHRVSYSDKRRDAAKHCFVVVDPRSTLHRMHISTDLDASRVRCITIRSPFVYGIQR